MVKKSWHKKKLKGESRRKFWIEEPCPLHETEVMRNLMNFKLKAKKIKKSGFTHSNSNLQIYIFFSVKQITVIDLLEKKIHDKERYGLNSIITSTSFNQRENVENFDQRKKPFPILILAMMERKPLN